MRQLRFGLWVASCLLLLAGVAAFAQGPKTDEVVVVDAHAESKPFPHFWEQMFGSGRAILTLRESYREDVKAVKKVADFKYVRFHAIFHDEVGVYNEDEHGNPVYNFAYVDSIYDGLLKNGVKPFVEISFMPKKLAFNPDALHPFWYKMNVSPPKSMEKWDGLVTAFTKHLIDRYGAEEVATWYFEVWNEPNIDFWNGVPRLESYFELYDHTARDIKAVNPRLRVGGPATAAAQWIPEFLAHVAENHVPIDFVTTHGYGDDTVENMFGTHEKIAVDDRVGRAIAKVRGEINKSPLPKLPLYWTEWNVPGLMQSRDTTYVGAALANTVRESDGNVDMLSFWTFSDVFEEGGPTSTPFRGDFGLRAFDGINKPSYYAHGLLHQLGQRRIANKSNNVIVTKDADSGVTLVAWNLVDPDQHGTDKTMELEFKGLAKDAKVTIERVDNEHGNVLPKWAEMGKPLNPTPPQAAQLNEQTALPAPEQATLTNGRLKLELEQNALVLVKVAAR